MENDSIKIARIEERLGNIHDDVKEIKHFIKDLSVADVSHGTRITKLEQDRKWIIGLIGGVMGLGSAFSKYLGSHF